MDEQTEEIRKVRFVQGPLLTAAAIFAPQLLVSEVEAANFSYQPYDSVSKQTVRNILSRNNYPLSFRFCYEVPSNTTDRNGDLLNASFVLSRAPGVSLLETRIKHPKEDKKITIIRRRSGENITYTETETDYIRGIDFKYNNSISISPNNKFVFVTNLLDSFLSREIFNTNFNYQGGNDDPRLYSLKLKEIDPITYGTDYEYAIQGDIRGKGKRVSKVRVFCRKFDDLVVPAEIWVDWEVRINKFLGIYDSHTIRGILQDKEC